MRPSSVLATLLPFVLSSPVHDINGDVNFIPSRGPADVDQQRDIPAAAKFNPSFLASGISPWSAEAQPDDTLDYKPVWKRCPENYLVCAKCPNDFRCKPPVYKPKPSPISGFNSIFSSNSLALNGRPKRPQPNFLLADPSEPAALTGPQLAHSKPAESTGPCSLKKCGDGRWECHSSTTCVRGYCRCESDLKAASGKMSRGWKYPESATVYVDAGSICDVPCRKQFCAEIPKTSGCFEDPKAGENSQRQPDVEDGGITKEEPSLNHGTIPAGLAAGGNDAIDIPGVPIGSSTEGDTDVGDIGESDFVVGLVAGGAAV